LIHDLGKLSEEFVKSKCVEESGGWIHHTAILEYDAYKNVPYARKVKRILENIVISVGNDSIKLYDFVLGHHSKLWNRKKKWNKPEKFECIYPEYDKNNIFLKFITASDTFDSDEDKSHSKDPQSICGVYKSTSFGFENESIEIDKLTEERKKVYKTIINWLDTCDFDEILRKRRRCMNEIRKSFSKALGETRRSANDVTLWDHSYMTATIMKALVAYRILDSSFEVYSKEKIIENKPFKIFAVGWNYFDFIKQSHKIPDVIGRIEILKEIKEEIKKIVEEDYALGNSIYDDDFGIYFLIPSIIGENDLKDIKEKVFDVFNEKVSGILLPVFHVEEPKSDEKDFRIGKLLIRAVEEVRKKEKEHKIELIRQNDLIKLPAWIEYWKSSVQLPKDRLICNVCGKGYYCKGDDEKICKTCKDLRKLGRRNDPPQTVFIDEIAWNPERKQYENVCLLIAKFDLNEWLNGKLVQSLFIREPERHYDDISWHNGKTLSGLSGVLGKTLRDKIRSNGWDREAKENVYNAVKSFLLGKVAIVKGKSTEAVACDVIKLIEKEIKDRKTLRDIISGESREYFITKAVFNFEYLDDLATLKLLKPPSPSRLMRIWNSTKEFLENISKLICLKVPTISECKIILKEDISNLTPNMAYLLEIENHSIIGEVISLEKTSRELHIITPHTNDFLIKNKNSLKDAKILLRHPDNKDKILGRGEIENIKENCDNNKAYRVISVSPTLFMAIIPASVSLDIVKMIKEEYMKRFGKVFGKLPLHIGLIYFKRKMPIFAVLDSANRMINEFNTEKQGENDQNKNEKEKWIYLQVASDPTDEDNYKVLELTKEEQKSFKYKVKIPYKLGEGNTDYYHPYLIVDDSSDDIIEIKIDGKTIIQKHISKIKKGDKIKVKKYYFDFEFLDSNIRRFDIGKKRKHWLFTDSVNSPKPYLLWDIDNFERLRKLIKKLGLTTTQIMNLYEMLMIKLEEWEIHKPPTELKNSKNEKDKEKAEVFEKLVENSIKDIPLRLEVIDGESDKGKISKEDFEFLKDSIMSGLFFDFVDLWHTILKLDFKEKENSSGGRESESI